MSHSTHFTECVTAELIAPEPVHIKDAHQLKRFTSRPFKFTDLSRIPEEIMSEGGSDLIGDEHTVLTCWDTNAYIKIYDKEGRFTTTEVLGSPLVYDKEYIIIKTAY